VRAVADLLLDRINAVQGISFAAREGDD